MCCNWLIVCFLAGASVAAARTGNDTLVPLPPGWNTLPVGTRWEVLDTLLGKPWKNRNINRQDLVEACRASQAATPSQETQDILHLLSWLSGMEQDTFSPYRAEELESWLMTVTGAGADEILAIGFNLLAHLYWSEGELARGLEFSIRAFKRYRHLSPERFPLKSKYWYEHANRYYYFRDFRTTRSLLQQMWEEIPYDRLDYRVSSLNTIAICYRQEGEWQTSDRWFARAMQEAKKEDSMVWIGILRGNMAQNLLLQGKFEEAVPLLEENIASSRERNVYTDLAFSLAGLSEVRLSMGQATEAYRLIREAVVLMEGQGKLENIEIRSRLLIPLGQALMATGRPAEAFAALDAGRIAQDTLNARRNALLLSGVQLKMEAESHLVTLQVKEEQIRQQRLWNFVLALIAVGVSVFTFVFFRQKKRIAREQRRSDELLLNILPADVARDLKQKGKVDARHFGEVTILFTDFCEFTQWVERHSADDLVADLDLCFRAFDDITTRYGLEKIKTIGDAYMAVAGLPQEIPDHAERAVGAALDIRNFVESERRRREKEGKSFFEIRLGLHSGPVVAGVIGLRKFTYDIWGDTVNLAARMESSGEAGRVNVSEATWSRISDRFAGIFRGRVPAKNKGEIGMYFVEVAGAGTEKTQIS